MPSGCPLKKGRYETPLWDVLVCGNSVSVMLCGALAKSLRGNRAVYGFSKPSCIACGFCCGVLGKHLSRQKRMKPCGSLFLPVGVPV